MSSPRRRTPHTRRAVFATVFTLFLLQNSSAQADSWQDQGRPPAGRQAPATALTAAWGRLIKTDGYGFTTRVSQERTPAPLLGNVGRGTQVDSLYLEGEVNRPERRMHLWTWSGADAAQMNSLSKEQSKDQALEVKIEGDRAFGRAGQGEWKEVDNIGALIAPGMDVAAYLVGARDVSSLGTESREVPSGAGEMRTLAFSKYRFVLDGAAISEYTNTQINAVLKERGELPPGLSLKTGSVFDDAYGEGELWVDGDGLPSRLKIDLEFPEEASGERVTAAIVTDFQDVRQGAANLPGSLLHRIAATTGNVVGGMEWDLAALVLLMFTAFACVCLLIRRSGRARLAQQVIAGVVVGQMVLSPVTTVVQAESQSRQVERFLKARGLALDGRSGASASTAAHEAATTDTAPSDTAPAFNTTQSPLERGKQQFAAQETLAAMASTMPKSTTSTTSTTSSMGKGTLSRTGTTSTPETSAASAPVASSASEPGTSLAPAPETSPAPLSPTDLDQGGDADPDQDGLINAREAQWGTDPAKPDSDGDGLKDGQEAELCLVPSPTLSPDEDSTCSHPRLVDTDGDGLRDNQEFLYLGTLTNAKDTDRDGIHDKAEVEGFGSPLRYTDPRNPDTDADGRVDGAECPERAYGKATPTACRDTDGDREPNVFDDDSDGDGFFDTVDSAPEKSIGTLAAPRFNATKPFNLAVRNVEAGRKLLVDFQVRPVTDSLAYPTSVLDWPTGDTSGQVQRRVDSTFGEVWNSSDPALANGDLRVVPMLELTMQSDKVPLPRVNAALTMPLVARTPLGNVQLYDKKEANQVEIRLSALDKRSDEPSFFLYVGTGTCTAHTQLKTFTDVDPQKTYILENQTLATIADGTHVLVLTNGIEQALCEPIGKAPENSRSMPFFFQRVPRTIGDAAFTQSGADIALNFKFNNPGLTYEFAMRNGTCAAPGALVFTASGLNAAAPSRVMPGQFLTQIATAGTVLLLKEADSSGQGAHGVICQPMPNLVNGKVSDTTMIDQDFLNEFNVTVLEADDAGKLVAYVPATQVVDARSGRTAGFGGRMAFDTAFGNAVDAAVRLVWQVQALTDFCADPPADYMTAGSEKERLTAWCGAGANQLQTVHQYADEGWSLAGLTVREEHSLQVAAVFEDPAKDKDVDSDDRLWHLADGLSDAFLEGRDCAAGSVPSDCKAAGGSDLARDLTVRGVYDRFRQGAPVLPGNDAALKWGLTDQVLDARWFTKDSSIGFGDIVEKDIPKLLDEKFLNAAGLPRASAPLVLFAGEEKFRATELDLPEYSAVAGDGLTVNFAASIGLKPATVTTLHWKPYQRVQDAAGTWRWKAYPLDGYWELLERRMAAAPAFAKEAGSDGELILTAQTRLAQVYFTSLYGGRSNLVQVGDQVVNPMPDDSVSDAARQSRVDDAASTVDLIKAGGLILGTLNPIVNSFAKQYLTYTQLMTPLLRRNNQPLPILGAKDLLKMIGSTIRDKTRSNWNNFLGDAVQSRGVKGKSGVRISILITGLSIASAAAGQDKEKVTFGSVATATLLVVQLASNIQSAVRTVEAAREVGTALTQGAAAAAKISKAAGEIAGAVATLVGELVAWGALLYSMGAAGLTPFGLAANELAAQGVAGTIVAVGLLALALAGPVGAVAAAVIALIDSLIALTCNFIPDEMIESNVGLEYFCKGLTGLAAEAVAYVIYAKQDMVSLSDPHRVQLTRFSPALKDPQTGFVTEKPVTVNLQVQNTLEVSDAPVSIGGLYAWQYSEAELKTASFAYSIVAQQVEDEAQELHNSVKQNQHPSEWQRVTSSADDTRHSIERTVTSSDGIATGPTPGLNRPVGALLAEGYAIPVQECVMLVVPFGVIPVPVPTCWVRERRDTNYTDLGVVFDVFPTTLRQFMAMTAVGGGQFAQAWGQAGELKLPALTDADGDGLPASADGDDSRWDADGDRISDRRELELGTLASADDSDRDGLPDWQELLRKTNPLLPDSDGDGLWDGEEITGWEVVYGANPTLKTWVRSDPLRADADADGILDNQEKIYGFNPYVVSDRNALEFETSVTELFAPDLILTLDDPAGATSFLNGADSRGETTVVCNDEKQIGYNAFIRGISVELGTNPPGGDFTLAVNGVAADNPIKAANGDDEEYVASVPIAASAQPKATPVRLTLTHSGNLAFSSSDPVLTIGEHEASTLPVQLVTFRGPNGATVTVSYVVLLENGHCPTSGFGGYYGRAVKFDGVGDALVVAGNEALSYLSRHFVISAWIRPDSVDPGKGKQVIVSNYGAGNQSPWLEFGTYGSELYADFGTGTGTIEVKSTGANLLAGQWNYVRMDMDDPNWSGGKATVSLIHGEPTYAKQEVTGLPAKIGGAGALFVGGRPNTIHEIERPFGGMLDELVIVAMPRAYQLLAATIGLVDGRYNPDDGVLARSEAVQLRVGLGSKLLNREIRGFHTVDFPSSVFDTPDKQTSLFLAPGQPPVRKFDGTATVRSNAPAGKFELRQTVGAAVTVPANELWVDPGGGEVFAWNDSGQFDGTNAVDLTAKNLELPGDFTLSAWIKPGPADKQRRGILGRSSHSATASPALEIEDNVLYFGYGDGTTWREVKAPQGAPPLGVPALTIGEWNYVAVAYRKSTQTATFYVNATGTGAGKDATLPGPVPSISTGGVFIGRSSNQATLTISKAHITCEYDYGGEGEYDILRHDGATDGTIVNFVGTDDTEKTGPWVLPFTGSTTIEMCEDDNNDRNDCADGDELMGKFTVSANEVFAPKTTTLSTRPEDPSCTYTFGYGWPETADLSYALDNKTIPFIGEIQKVSIFNRHKSQSDVDALRRGVTYVADFRLDEFPESAKFKDFSSFHEATCSMLLAQCPQSGVNGVDEQAIKLDGANDYLVADGVSAAAGGSPGLTFGAWVKKERAAGDDVVLAFNAADGGGRNMLLTKPDGPNGFTFAYYDDTVHEVQAAQKPLGVLLFNHWYHLAVTIDAANQGTLWINSQPAATFVTSVRPDANGRFSIGQEWDMNSPSDLFEGWIDRAFVAKTAFNGNSVEVEKNRAPLVRWGMEAETFLSTMGGADYQFDNGVRGDSLRLPAGALATDAGGRPIELPFINKGAGENYTVSIWVKAEAFTQTEGGVLQQTLWSIGDEASSSRQLTVYVRDGIPIVRQREPQGSSSGELSYLVSPQPLIPNVWQQLTVRHQGTEMALFINGSQVLTQSAWGPQPSRNHPGPAGITLGSFQGLADEFQIYHAALTDREIREQYNRQNAWMEDQESVRMTVSVDPPTVTLPITRTYFAMRNMPVLIETKGTFAEAVRADLLINGIARTPARAVLDAAPGSAWMATFGPVLGERDYALQARATDKTGNQSAWSTPANTIYVDGTAPAVTMNPVLPQPASLKRAPGDASSFVIPLGGSVNDPPLKSIALPGSGTAFVEVTVYNAKSKTPVAAPQRAKITGQSWLVDYLVQVDNMTGDYVVDIVAEDAVGNRSPSTFNLPAELASRTLKIDTTAPLPKLVRAGSTFAQAAMRAAVARAQGSRSGSASADGPSPNTIAAGQPAWLGPDALLEGTVDEAPTLAVTATNFAGVDTVETAFEPLESAGVAVRNVPLPASALLYLPMDESGLNENAGDTAFGDLVAGKTAVCAGDGCPEAGAAGKSGQALTFDDQDDQLTVANVGNIASKTGGFTLAAWVWPTATTGQRRILMTGDATGGNGFGLGLDGNRNLIFTQFGVMDYPTAYNFVPNHWVHVAAALDQNGLLTTFINGRMYGSGQTAGPTILDTDTTLVIGRNTDGTRFDGRIDEVAVFGEALSEAQVAALMGDAPTLEIPFDERNVSGEAELADASGLGSIVRRTGPAGNVTGADGAAKGIVGTNALDFNSSLGHTLTITPQKGTMPMGNEAHSIAGWFKMRPQGERSPSSLVLESGGTSFEQFDFYLDTGAAYVWAGSHATGWVNAGFAANAWQHFAVTYDGTTYTTWLNGQKGNDAAVIPFAIPRDVTLSLQHFNGQIDDLKVFRRSLSATEIRGLAATGWSDAAVDARGPTTKSTTWHASPPAGLEGYYELGMRATDTQGNYVSDPDTAAQWRGTVDTLAPRLISSASVPGASSVAFTLQVEDFNLDLNTLDLPGNCAADKRVTETRYLSPWYLALAESTAKQITDTVTAASLRNRTFKASIECRATYVVADESYGICDQVGNCLQLRYTGPSFGNPPPTPTAGTSPTATQSTPGTPTATPRPPTATRVIPTATRIVPPPTPAPPTATRPTAVAPTATPTPGTGQPASIFLPVLVNRETLTRP